MAGPLVPALIAGGASVLGGLFAKDAADKAAGAQLEATRLALAQFEKNAGIATQVIEDRFSDAEGTVRNTAQGSSNLIQDGAVASIDSINTGAFNSRNELIRGSQDANRGLEETGLKVRDNIMQTFGFQESEINEAAVASSQFINEARESAASAINRGFNQASGEITSARDISNELIIGSVQDATERLNVARANAVAVQNRGLKNIRSDFQPFIDAGVTTIEGVTELVNNPEAQRDFIQNNPFFDEIANESERRLLQNQAAKGRVGSGSTQLELRNRLMAAGNELLNAEVARRMGVVNVGMDAATRVQQAEMNRANAISNIEQATGQSLANLVTTAAQNRAQINQNAANSLASLAQNRGTSLANIDQNAGTQQANIEQNRAQSVSNAASQGSTNLANSDLRIGAQMANNQNNLGVNLSNLETNRGNNVANTITGASTNLANINTNMGNNIANIQTGQGTATANTLINQGTTSANLITQGGNAQASGIVGGANAVTNTLQDLGDLALITAYGPRNTQSDTQQWDDFYGVR